MTEPQQAVDVAHLIQLALAPVFLLSGIGVILGVLTNRLARVVDRARQAEERSKGASEAQRGALQSDLRIMARRARYINRAITLSTVSAIAVAFVVVLLFVNAFSRVDLSVIIALLFVTSILCLAAALLTFLVEVRVATAALRIGH
jgi:hypothetical protein